MQVLLINDQKPAELWGKAFPFEGIQVVVDREPSSSLLMAADVCIDLLFEQHPQHIHLYKESGKPVLIASVLAALSEFNIHKEPIARFNNWPTLDHRNILELAVNEAGLSIIESVLNQWQVSFQRTKDEPGFVSARILAAIINEAYFACGEEVSAPSEIDTAMKLGTNYPYGPFEWASKIGIKNVCQLLDKLSATEPRYQPAPLLKQKIHEQ
jgi:3-hydroxybutyryl-CoA dehydrogenase